MASVPLVILEGRREGGKEGGKKGWICKQR